MILLRPRVWIPTRLYSDKAFSTKCPGQLSNRLLDTRDMPSTLLDALIHEVCAVGLALPVSLYKLQTGRHGLYFIRKAVQCSKCLCHTVVELLEFDCTFYQLHRQ
jgi:hypothetical protein